MSAAEIHPAYDPPYLRLAEILEQNGRSVEAREFLALAERLRVLLEGAAP